MPDQSLKSMAGTKAVEFATPGIGKALGRLVPNVEIGQALIARASISSAIRATSGCCVTRSRRRSRGCAEGDA